MRKLTDYQAVIFDMDGTLLDSMWMWKDIDIRFLSQHGLDMPEDLQKEIEGMSFAETAVYFKERFRLQMSVEAIMKVWNDMTMDSYVNDVRLKPGARDLLRYLKAHGVPMGIATSNSRELAMAALKAHRIEDCFGTVLTGGEGFAGKPAPDMFLEAARRLGADPEECLAMEDVEAGAIAALRAGMEVVVMQDDWCLAPPERMKEISDRYITDFWELIEE